MLKYYVALLLFLPGLTLAQAGTTGSLQSLLAGIGGFLNSVVIPFILAIAFIVFVVNVVRFFVIGGDSDEGQKNAKNLAIYGIGAFVFILSFWGIINMLVEGVGLGTEDCAGGIISDYVNRDGDPCVPETERRRPDPEEPPPDDDINPDPDPNDPIPDTPPEELLEAKIQQHKEALRRARFPFEDIFGAYAESIKGRLMTGLTTETNRQYTLIEIAREVNRAEQIGALAQGALNELMGLIRAVQLDEGIIERLTGREVRETTAVPIPSPVERMVTETKARIERQLDLYQARVDQGGFAQPLTLPGRSNPATPQEVVTYLFDQTVPAETRENYLIELITNPHDVIDASEGDEIYNEYIDANNALTTFNAQFDVVGERDPRFPRPR